jgi:hypothetical protein
MTGNSLLMAFWFKGLFLPELGSWKDSQAGPLTALFFLWRRRRMRKKLVKICSNYLG